MLKLKQLFLDALITMLLFAALSLLFALLRTNLIWGNVYIEQILANATNTGNGIADDVIRGYMFFALLPALILAFILVGLIKKTRYVLLIVLLCLAYPTYKLQIIRYIINQNTYSDIYDKEYIDPQSNTYVFPEHKRNLIVLHMESIESEYENPALAGRNLLPALSKIAQENISFNNFHQLDGQDYTIAAMVASYCGVPFKLFNNKDFTTFNNFLPRLTCYPQILEQNGYKLYFMKGAPLDFTRTGMFFSSHGFHDVAGTHEFESRFGLNLTKLQGNSWGFRDSSLYALAKKRLTEIAAQNTPFVFSMLTVDTHAPDFYLDKQCENTGNNQADAVACADFMAADFINWLKKQKFYSDTTVIILGDHTQTGGNNMYPQVRNRHIFNAVINSAIPAKPDNQAWTTVDLPATVLQALGVKYNGKFGLGRSLFGNDDTLFTKYGKDLDNELKKTAKRYNEFNRTRYVFKPQYNAYGTWGKITPDKIKTYASFSDISFNAIWLDTLSFTLPETKAENIKLNINFKLLFMQQGKRTVTVFANGQKLREWKFNDGIKQPINRSLNIPTYLIDNGKLLLEFKSDTVGFTAAGVGIGINDLTLTED